MKPNIKNAPRFRSQLLTIILLTAICVIGCSSMPGTSTSGSQFEGVIQVKYYDSIGLDRATFSFKNNFYRSESVNTEGVSAMETIIVDYKTGIQKMINQTEKTYHEINPRELDKSLRDLIRLPKFTPTGRTETIAGYTCEHYLLENQQNPIDEKLKTINDQLKTINEQRKTTMCFTEGLGYIGSADDFHRSGIWQFFQQGADEKEIKARMDSDPVLKKLIENGAYMMKMSVVENGREKTIMEVTSVERKSLDDSLFQVPAGYKKVESPFLIPKSDDGEGK
jgi:Domain of unknown function (DUF4412)